MPAISIDTFFACTLIIMVSLSACAYVTVTLQGSIDGSQNLNKESLLRTIADNIISNCGSPVNWGSNINVPDGFGLADASASQGYVVDVDKISRLNTQSIYCLSYVQVFNAARLNNIALGISVTQSLSIDVSASGNATVGDQTAYNFTISVCQDARPITAYLNGYVTANNYLGNVSGETNSAGTGNLSFQLPNSCNGSALLIVFARSKGDERLTAYQTFAFSHLTGEVKPNQTFLQLSPLDHSLSFNAKISNLTVSAGYAFSFNYQSNLTLSSNSTYAIPNWVDKSPIVLATAGFNGSTYFVEWAAYPYVPLTFGADFSSSEAHVFVYNVIIGGVFYKLTLTLGDVVY